MQQAGLLHLAATDRVRFDALRRNEQLPFYGGPENENQAVRARHRFTIGQAFALRLMLDLIGDEGNMGGVPPSKACGIISNSLMSAREKGFLTLGDFVDGRALIGAAILEERGPDDAERLRFSRWVACTADDLAQEIAAIAAGEDARLVRLLLVNAARTAQDVIDRARAIGISDRAEDEAA